MKYVSTNETMKKQKKAMEMNFESFKATLTMAGFNEGDLKRRFEEIDQIFDLTCCYKGSSLHGNETISYCLIARKDVDVSDFFRNKLYTFCSNLDVLSLELLYLKMLEQKPFDETTIEKAQSIAYMNEVKSNILDNGIVLQLASSEN